MNRTQWWTWGALLVLDIAIVAFLLTTSRFRDPDLCPPDQPVAMRLAQTTGAREPGVVYLNFAAARAARDGIDGWLREHGTCP